MSEHRITAGFLPLTDSLVLVAAREKGFAAAQGVELVLVRETSWANIRDRIAVGHFDVAHMLAPMPIAANLGLTPIADPVIAPFALGLGGNCVTVSRGLWERMAQAGAPSDLDAARVGKALAQVVRAGGRRLRFGVVHPHSSHSYELRYWLAASGIHPVHDVEIVILPPPLMADALAAGGLDGYCVGEPWNSMGVESGAGRIATVKANIWRNSPEKVLGVAKRWADSHVDALSALLKSLHAAARWCGDTANHAEAASLLAGKAYLGVPEVVVRRALSGTIQTAPGETAAVPDFFVPFAGHANMPWPGHALWFYSQMVRWSDVAHDAANARHAAASFRPDLYRAAISEAPAEDARGAETFFDGRIFDPAELEDYLAAQC